MPQPTDLFRDSLVLGSTGYRKAYDESKGGFAKTRLRIIAPYPVIFIGFSMTDEAVEVSIEEIARTARYRSVTPIDGDAEEAISPLKWYIFLKAPAFTDPRRDEVKLSREERLSNVSVKVIWYQDGGESDPHRSLLEVLQSIQRESRDLTVSENDPTFVERLIEAEEIASLQPPTSSQIRRSKAILEGHPRIAEAFLNRVDGVDWFRGLRDSGSLQPKPSYVTANGERRAPHWRVVGFLERVASAAPTEVKEFLLGVDIDNWFAIRQAFGILEALDDESGVDLGARFASWAVKAMSVDSYSLLDVSRAADSLNLNGKQKAAQELVESTILEFANTTLTFSEGVAARFSEAVVPVLGRSDSGLKTLEDARSIALARECSTPEQDNFRYSRPAIEVHRMNPPERSIVGLLIDVTRETLLKTDDAERRYAAITTLLGSEWPTERRIGIAHCFLRRSDFVANEAAIVTRENFANPNLYHELAKLMKEGVEGLSNRARQEVKDFVKTLEQGTTDSQQNEYRLWAKILPADFLPVQIGEREEDSDDPESFLFRDFYSFRTFTLTAPMDKASFANRAATLNTDQLLDLVREPTSAGLLVTWRHSAASMWILLAEYAKEQGKLELLLKIDVDDIGGDEVWRAIETMPEIAGDDSARWEEVLVWTEKMIQAVDTNMLWPLGRLLLNSAKATPIGLSERISALAVSVIEKGKRTPELDSETIRDSLLHGFLNHPSGMAVHALFELLRRELIEYNATQENREMLPEWFSKAVLEPVAKEPMALGVDAWIGIGRFYSLLSSRATETVEFVASYLRSQTSDLSIAAIGFWSGYLWAPLVSSDVLRQLLEVYRSHASILEQQRVLEDDLRDQFFHHLVIGALRDLPGYDGLLFSTISAGFRPETRGSIAFSLGRGLQEAAEEPGTEFHDRTKDLFVRYWTAQVDGFGGQDGPQLAKYLLWLNDLSMPPGAIAHLVEASLAQAVNSFDVGETFNYLKSHVENEPTEVLRLLERCVDWYRLHGDFWLATEEVRSLLYRIAQLTSTAPTLRDVVEGFTELGAITIDDARALLSGTLI